MYLVTGASGHLGQAVINHLLTTYKVPANKIIAASRDIGKLAGLKTKGIEVRKADFEDEAGLVKAFTGATRVLLISTDAMAPGQRLAQHQRAVAAAEKAGVDHVLYTSLHNADTSKVTFAPDHVGTEKALAQSKLKGWTVLRNTWYFENLFHSIPQALKGGAKYTAAGKGKIAHIARDDLARAAAAALASDKGGKNIYTLTGHHEYTTDEIAALVSSATGKALNVVHVPFEGLMQGMIGAGVPEAMAKIFASFDVNTAQGGLSGVSGDFKALTGREPRKFEDWLNDNAKALAA
jgi:NAD(P)H dehydrogenase (quinone)